MSKKHRIDAVVARHPETWGYARYVSPSFDNRSFACERTSESGVRRIVLNNQVCAEWSERHVYPKAALSYDGKKLAVAMEVREKGTIPNVAKITNSIITINGVVAYQVPFETVYRFDWIDNNLLAWSAWSTDDNHEIDAKGIRYFVNGVDMTDTFEFEPVGGEHDGMVFVKNGKVLYRVHCDGTKSSPLLLPEEDADIEQWQWTGMLWPEKKEDANAPEIVVEGTKPAQFLDSVLGHTEDRADRHKERTDREPWWMWPIALLFNPYFGIGHLYLKMSERYHVVGNKRWKKCYRFAENPFYTPNGELVVTVANKQKMAVVIDEIEGQWWDEVYAPRFLPQENCVSYLARAGNEFFRIVVD